jgi:outer membrane cobalamin receptor
MRILLLLAACLSFFVPASFAQTPATLAGTLTDPSGAAIAGAKISARALDRQPGRVFQASSGPEGKYRLALPAGRYHAAITDPSFVTQARELTLRAGETMEWSARLRLRPLAATVTVAAEAEPMPVAEASSPVDVVTRKEIDERQALWLAPLLASLPGMTLAQLGPEGGITSLFLDGGNSNFTKVLIDGTPANEPGGAVDSSNYSLANVAKIEVVHGAASALDGSDAMAGVVEIFTERGTTRTPRLTLASEGGKYGTWHAGSQLSGLLGRFDYAAGGDWFATNGQGLNDRFRDNTLSGNFGWRFSPNDSLRLALRNSSSDAGEAGQTLLVPPDPNQHDRLRNFSANLSWDFDTGAHWQHRLGGSESYIRQIFADPPFFTSRNEYSRAGFREQSSYLFRHGALTAGYNYEVENGFFSGTHARRNNQAGYLEARYQLGPRLTLTAGGRAEANASFGTRVVPRVGASYLARKGGPFWGATRVYASYGLGIKEPSFLQSFSADPCFAGNPNLRPERSRTVHAGVDQQIAGGGMRLGIDAFSNRYTDIVSFAAGPVSPACPYGTGFFFNTDAARAYGASVTFEAAPTRRLRFDGNYTYDASRVLRAPNAFDPTLAPGNRLFLRPLNSANFIANASLGRMNWNLASYYVGRRTDSDFLGLGLTSVASYLRVDLATSLRLGHGLESFVRVENLLNRRYQIALGYPTLRIGYRAGMKYTWGGE